MLSTWNRLETACMTVLVAVIAIATFAVAISSGVLPGAGANAARAGSASEPHKELPASLPKWATSDFPTNDAGLTYGSDSEADTDAEAPDLIAVVGDSGIAGFVAKKDLYGPEIQTPEDAAEWERHLAEAGAPVITVYDLSGRKVDEFTLHLGVVGTSKG